MTVESTISRVDFVSTDGQTVFQFSFKYFESDDISVFVNDVEQTTGFTVTPSAQGVNFGGTVTFATGQTLNDRIAIVRILDILQESDYEENDRLPSQQLEDDLDRAAMINQQQQESLARRPALADSSLISNVLIQDPTVDDVGHAFVWRQNPDDTFFLATSDENVDEALQNIEDTLNQAQDAADEATAQAGIATTQAGIATTQAGEATTQAGNAAASATQADQAVQSVNFPAGFVAYYARNQVPNGWLYCNGQAVSRTSYSVLFGIIGTTYGSGDGSTTFNVPDLRSEFLRGFDDRLARAFGSHQDDAAPSITGSISLSSTAGLVFASSVVTGAFSRGTLRSQGISGSSADNSDINFDAANSSPVYGRDSATEIRPDNTVLLPCIKAFGAVTQETQDLQAAITEINAILASITVGSTTQAGLVEVATQAEVDEGTDPLRTVSPATLRGFNVLSTKEMFAVSHTVPAATSGGTKNSGWQTRPLQTVERNTITGASLNVSNFQMTLPAGEYYVEGFTSCFSVGDQTARIRTTGNALLVGGGTSRDANTNYAIPVPIQGYFSLASSTTLILDHYSDAGSTTNGFGAPSSNSNFQNKYAELTFFKVG